jgi:hypothetical protein
MIEDKLSSIIGEEHAFQFIVLKRRAPLPAAANDPIWPPASHRQKTAAERFT